MGTHPIFESDFDCLTVMQRDLEYSILAQNVTMAAISHPLKQSRILMQLGYEPGPIKVKGPSMFGLSKGGEFRSGVLTGYLKESGILQEGNVTKNVTAGMTMSICEVVASSLVQTAVTPAMEDAFPKAEKAEESYSDYNQVLTDITRETAIKTAGIVASNPFKVVAIRQIAALAGDSHSTSLKDVIMSGDLFAGVGPRVLYEASVIFISKTLKYLCRQHGKAIGIEADQQALADRAIDLIPSFFVYPLQLIATIRSIGGTGLRLDEFPELSMLELYLTLKARGETQRGSSVIMDRKCPKSKAIHVAPAVQIEPVIEPVVEAPVVIEIPPVVESQIPEAQPVEQEQKQ